MISQVLTLYITPVMYLYLEKCQEFFVTLPAKLRRAAKGAPREEPIGIENHPATHKAPLSTD